MTTLSVPVLAGAASTVIFAVSTLPMLVKAYRSRDLSSYSLGNIGLANVGNAVHSVYVFSLPPGPIWALHTLLPGELRRSCWAGTCGTACGDHPIGRCEGWVDRPTRQRRQRS